MLCVPLAGIEVGGEPLEDLLLDPRLEQFPDRLGGADGRVEQRLGAIPEGLEEAVGAVGRGRDPLDPDLATKLGGDLVEGAEAGLLERDRSSEVVALPGDQIGEFEGEDDDRAAGDSAQLGKPGARDRPSDGSSRRPSPHRPSHRRAAAIRPRRPGTAPHRPAAAPASSRSARPPAPSGRAAHKTPPPHRHSAPSAHLPAPLRSAPRTAGPPSAAARTQRRAFRSRPAQPPDHRTGLQGGSGGPRTNLPAVVREGSPRPSPSARLQSTWPGVR